MTPALQFRLSLAMPPQLDVRRCTVVLYTEDGFDSDRFVVASRAIADGEDFDAMDVDAATSWAAKYGEPMPADVSGSPIQTLLACYCPYPGPTPLDAVEIALLSQAQRLCRSVAPARADGWAWQLTLDELLLVREGLGWRLGRSVREDDPGWLAVWAEEEEDAHTIDVIREALGMPELRRVGDGRDASVMPLSVRPHYLR